MKLRYGAWAALLLVGAAVAGCGGGATPAASTQVQATEPTVAARTAPVRLNQGGGESAPAPKPDLTKLTLPKGAAAPAAPVEPAVAVSGGGSRLGALALTGGNPLAMLSALSSRQGADSASSGGPSAAPARTQPTPSLSSYRFAVQFALSFRCGDAERCRSGEAGAGQQGTVAETLTASLSGAFAGPDRFQLRCQFAGAGLTMDSEAVAIGDQTWVRSDGGRFERREAAECDPRLDVTELAKELQGEQLDQFTVAARGERVNGVATTKYVLDLDLARALQDELATFVAMLTVSPTGQQAPGDTPVNLSADATLWLADQGGYPVKAVFGFRFAAAEAEMAVTMSYDLTDIDSPSVAIAAP